MSTNNLKMSFSILIDILNIGKTFLFGLCFIKSESLATFTFVEDMLDKLFFYDCLWPEVVCGDFAKSLASAISIREAKKRAEDNEEAYILQLYEWHGVEDIKRHLVAAGKYLKDPQNKIINLI